MKTILFLILSLCFTACDEDTGSGKKPNLSFDVDISTKQYSLAAQHSITYFYDERTKLCFAGYDLGYKQGLFTNVPCTPEVLALIEK